MFERAQRVGAVAVVGSTLIWGSTALAGLRGGGEGSLVAAVSERLEAAADERDA